MNPLTGERIRFFSAFRLKHETGSEAETEFLREYSALGSVPGVENFELMREITPKEWSTCEWVVMWEFADLAAHTAFHEHPAHHKFVAEYWNTGVAEFKAGNAVALTAPPVKIPSPSPPTPQS